jgi:uncharacterized protein DUF6011
MNSAEEIRAEIEKYRSMNWGDMSKAEVRRTDKKVNELYRELNAIRKAEAADWWEQNKAGNLTEMWATLQSPEDQYKREIVQRAMSDEHSRTERQLWAETSMPIVPFLDKLRDAIINGPEPPKRTPKWRIKLADDLGVEMQAKDSARILFECRALAGSGLTADSFKESHKEHLELRHLTFRVLQGKDEGWIFKATFAYYSSDDDARKNRLGGLRRMLALKNRVIEALGPSFRDDSIPMLADACIVCGRPLTDDVSRSRLIGPECYGKNNILAPLFTRPEDIKYESAEEFWGQVKRETF